MAYIEGIDTSKPAFNDPAGEGDDQIRTFKGDVKTSFPNINGPVTVTPTQLNYTAYIPADTNNELSLKAPLAAPALTGAATLDGDALATLTAQTFTGKQAFSGEVETNGTLDVNGLLDLNNMTNILTNGKTISEVELGTLDGIGSTNISTQLAGKAALNGSTGQRFDVAAPNANDQAIRRDTYAASTTGGTVKMRVSGTDLFIRNDGTNA